MHFPVCIIVTLTAAGLAALQVGRWLVTALRCWNPLIPPPLFFCLPGLCLLSFFTRFLIYPNIVQVLLRSLVPLQASQPRNKLEISSLL